MWYDGNNWFGMGGFGIVGLLRSHLGGTEVRHYNGLARRNPSLAIALTILATSASAAIRRDPNGVNVNDDHPLRGAERRSGQLAQPAARHLA